MKQLIAFFTGIWFGIFSVAVQAQNLTPVPKNEQGATLDRPVVIPFDYRNQEIIVKVKINGSDPLVFLFDTGTSDLIIDRKVGAEQGLDKQDGFNIAAVSGTVPTEMATVNRLEIGNLSLSSAQALLVDLSGQSKQLGFKVAGIIGTKVVSRFVFTIDYAKQIIIVGNADTYNPPVGASIVPFVNGLVGPQVEVVLNGASRQAFLVDTGAAFNHLTFKQSRNYLVGQKKRVVDGTGLDGRVVRLGLVVLNSVRIGNQLMNRVEFTFPLTANDNSQVLQHENLGVLGNPFWQNFILAFDYRSKRLILQLNKIQKARQEVSNLVETGDHATVLRRDYRVAETAYQKALTTSRQAGDLRTEAISLGRLGNLHRIMAKDLRRKEQAQIAFDYFNRALPLATKYGARDVEGRIWADWSLLYSDNGQATEAQHSINAALALAPQDPAVNIDYAVHLYRAKMYGPMQEYVERALAIEPDNWQGLWYQVKLSELYQDERKLKSTLKKILQAYPWSTLAKTKLNNLSSIKRP